MNPLAIAVQGIGFGVTLMVFQGISPAVEVTTPPAIVSPVSYNVTTRDWIKVHREDVLKEPATATIPNIVGEAVVEPIVAKGAASTTTKSTSGSGHVSGITAIGQASVKLAVAQTTASFGRISAYGQHDMEDTDLLAMLLTLLDA